MGRGASALGHLGRFLCWPGSGACCCGSLTEALACLLAMASTPGHELPSPGIRAWEQAVREPPQREPLGSPRCEGPRCKPQPVVASRTESVSHVLCPSSCVPLYCFFHFTQITFYCCLFSFLAHKTMNLLDNFHNAVFIYMLSITAF